MKTTNRLAAAGLLIVAISLFGCQFSYKNIEYERATQSIENKDYVSAVKHLGRVVKRDPESPLGLKAARQAAQISGLQLEDFKNAIHYFSHLVTYSKDQSQRLEAQQSIAEIYFEKLQDYGKAIEEYHKLLKLPHSLSQEVDYKMAVAKSYFYLNQFYQAQVEAESLLTRKLSKKDQFQIKSFIASVHLTTKDYKKAVDVYSALEKEFPTMAADEKLALNIVLCYEELQEYDKAIEVLKDMKTTYPQPEFIDLRIQRLQQRQQNLPGAKGLRK